MRPPCVANHCTGATPVKHKGARATRGGARDTRGNHEGARTAHGHRGSVGRRVVDSQDNTQRGGRMGPPAHGSAARHVVDDRNVEGSEQQRPQTDPRINQHTAQCANDWAPRTRNRHQQEHRPQRPTERSDPTQHAKGRTGDCPGPRKETATRLHVPQGGVADGCSCLFAVVGVCAHASGGGVGVATFGPAVTQSLPGGIPAVHRWPPPVCVARASARTVAVCDASVFAPSQMLRGIYQFPCTEPAFLQLLLKEVEFYHLQQVCGRCARPCA